MLPAGTVTFLFTDIEGSTQLLRHLGSLYRDLLADHHRLVRTAIAEGGGAEIDTAGDGFFVAFGSATRAVETAVKAQRAMSGHRWPDGVSVRVRMGLHTGEAVPVNDRYVGLDVHRAARIAAAGHGGQILVSATTARLVEVDGDLVVVDLGQHRLKDLPSEEHIFQVTAEDLPSRFPPLASIDAARTNLLDKVSSFVGRETEVGQASELLRGNRVVTLTGPGGTGKTRLAIKVGKGLIPAFPDGVWMIPLAPVTSDEAIPQACLEALGLHEQAGRALVETLIEYLQQGVELVVLDNCEHLLAAAGQLVAHIVERCPEVAVLATSREPLRVAGEMVFPVPALGVPPPNVTSVGDLNRYDSVRLFVERAAAASIGFAIDDGNAADIAALVRRLDGIPLALELAAARVGSLSVDQIVRRLDDSFELLRDRGSTAEARHRTLSATVAWSHELLTPEEQTVVRRLSVFRGTFDLDAAEYVAAGAGLADATDITDVVAALVDRSLVVAERGTGGYRYRMLEVVRHYAATRLRDAGEEAATRDRQAEWVAQQIGPALWPLNPTPAWYTARMTDYHNIEAAHDWLVQTGRAPDAIRMTVALGWLWYNEGYWTEGRTRVSSSLALPDDGESLVTLRAQACVVAALLAFRQGDYAESLELADAAERLAGDGSPTLCATARTTRALALTTAERLDDATEAARSVLAYARAQEGDWFVGAVLIAVGRVAMARGDFEAAARLHAEAAPLMDAAGDPWALATSWEGVGVARLYQRDTDGAAEALRMSLDANPIADDKASIPVALLGACVLDKDITGGLRLIEEGADVIFRRRDWVGRAILVAGVVPALVRHRLLDEARSIVDRDLAIARSTDDRRRRCRSLAAAARFFARTGDSDRASALASELLAIRAQLDEDRQTANALFVVADVVLERGAADTAARLWGAAEGALTASRPSPLPIEDRTSAELRGRIAAALADDALGRELAAGAELSLSDALRLARGALGTGQAEWPAIAHGL
jgi:predicted ATPase/class 3 adenylate cyclase/tetratricopeptide (TPR) repeat protein